MVIRTDFLFLKYIFLYYSKRAFVGRKIFRRAIIGRAFVMSFILDSNRRVSFPGTHCEEQLKGKRPYILHYRNAHG